MKFKVDKKFFDKVDNACFGVIIARGIDNTKDYPFIKELLNKEINNISKEYQDKKVKELPEIELYREAFRKLDINPNKYDEIYATKYEASKNKDLKLFLLFNQSSASFSLLLSSSNVHTPPKSPHIIT